MKNLLAAAALSAIASVAIAHDEHWGGTSDLYKSPLLDHGPSGPAGAPYKGEGDLYGSYLENPELLKATPGAKALPWVPRDDIRGDQYQTIVFGAAGG